MAIFYLHQFEHKPFWQYLSRLNDYHAQYMHFMYEKWKICNVVVEGITHEARATLESMCYGGLCSLNDDDMWDLFEYLASYQLKCECASDFFVFPSPPPYVLHAPSPFVDQFRMDVITILLILTMYVLIVNLLTMM